MNKRARIIFNPTSGREKMKTRLTDVIIKFNNNGYTVEVFPTQYAGHAKELARMSCVDEVNMLVVSGGDGTLNEVINGVADEEIRPLIAYIPSGTTNDFANAATISLDFDKALDNIFSGEAAEIDLAKINDKYFVNIGCYGLFTRLSYETPSKFKTVFGHLAYVINGVTEVPNLLKKVDVKIIVDDEEVLEEKFAMFFVANTSNFAGFKEIVPEAKINDGFLDVIGLTTRDLLFVPELVKSLSTGVKKNTKKNGFYHRKVKKIEIQSIDGSKLKWNVDGEFAMEGDAVIECKPKHIQVIFPKNSKII